MNPAGVEVCNDGLDNDCDGTPNHCEWDASYDLSDHTLLEAACDGAGFGYGATLADLDGDGADELWVGSALDCAPGSTAQVGGLRGFGLPLAATRAEDADWSILGEEVYTGLGTTVQATDLDGDGFTDLVSAAPWETVDGLEYTGAVQVFLGPLSSTGNLDDLVSWTVEGPGFGEYETFSQSMRVVGDVDGDGAPGFAAGSYAADTTLNFSGGAWRFTTVATGTAAAEDIATASVYGTELEETVGSSTCGADLDGDGLSDWVVTARNSDVGGVFIYQGPVSGSLSPADADIIFQPETSSHSLSETCDDFGDTNHDGLADLTFAAEQTANGTAYVVWGSTSLADMTLSAAELKIRGDITDRDFAHIAAPAGDVNQDGFHDLAVSDGFHASDEGAAYVFYGPFTTSSTLGASDADIIFEGDGLYDQRFRVMYGGHDVTGDGVHDMLVATPDHDDFTGGLYIVPGTGY